MECRKIKSRVIGTINQNNLPIYVINAADEIKLSCNMTLHQRGITVSLETYQIYLIKLFIRLFYVLDYV